MTQTLNELKLPTLQQRRLYNRTLFFFYKIANGLVPAINKREYLRPVDNKRKIKSKEYNEYVVNNPVLGLSRNKKSTQRTNFQSISYFAYSFMKLTLMYIKVVKYFS